MGLVLKKPIKKHTLMYLQNKGPPVEMGFTWFLFMAELTLELVDVYGIPRTSGCFLWALQTKDHHWGTPSCW